MQNEKNTEISDVITELKKHNRRADTKLVLKA